MEVNENLHISEEGLKFIANWEGMYLRAYDDLNPKKILKKGDKIIGTLTIGIGHVENVYIGQTITEKEAWDLFRKDLSNDYELRVKRYLKVPVSQTTFDSLVSRAYNVGNVINVANALNKGDNELALKLMEKPNTSKGIVLSGLTKRRMSEKEMLKKGLEESIQPIERDLELEKSVSKIIKSGINLSYNDWKRLDRIQLKNVDALINKLGGLDKLVEMKVISNVSLWKGKKYTKQNVVSLLKKYASKLK